MNFCKLILPVLEKAEKHRNRNTPILNGILNQEHNEVEIVIIKGHSFGISSPNQIEIIKRPYSHMWE